MAVNSTPLDMVNPSTALHFTCYIAHIGDGRYENKKALAGFFYVCDFMTLDSPLESVTHLDTKYEHNKAHY